MGIEGRKADEKERAQLPCMSSSDAEGGLGRVRGAGAGPSRYRAFFHLSFSERPRGGDRRWRKQTHSSGGDTSELRWR